VSAYQRLVSYIYLYDKGIKAKNSGFAKIECKNNLLRIKLNLKGAFQSDLEQWRVYLVSELNKELMGLYLGDIKCMGMNAEFQTMISSENIGGTGKNFDEIIGLMVISAANKKYATFWQDTILSVENFRRFEERVQGTNKIEYVEAVKKKKTEPILEDYLEAMSVAPVEEDSKLEVKDSQPDKENPQQPVIDNSSTMVKEVDAEVEVDEEISEKTVKNIRTESIEEYGLEENWCKLMEEYKQIHPFSDKDHIQCIRVELKDLKLLPKSQWILSSNSFVLHGYYNYQYLILGKMENRFILGVPGVFCNKEKLVANLFGFTEFKAAQLSDYKTGRFGYWYKYL
jgi:hypothetical protein